MLLMTQRKLITVHHHLVTMLLTHMMPRLHQEFLVILAGVLQLGVEGGEGIAPSHGLDLLLHTPIEFLKKSPFYQTRVG